MCLKYVLVSRNTMRYNAIMTKILKYWPVFCPPTLVILEVILLNLLNNVALATSKTNPVFYNIWWCTSILVFCLYVFGILLKTVFCVLWFCFSALLQNRQAFTMVFNGARRCLNNRSASGWRLSIGYYKRPFPRGAYNLQSISATR